MILEILLILVLTVVNGLLSMSELAVVSSRPARLASMAEKGDHGAQVALDLLDHASGEDLRLTLVKGADHRFSSPDCLNLIVATIEEVVQNVRE